MKTSNIDQDRRERSQDAPALSGLVDQYMHAQFQSTLSQFEKATLPEDSPLNKMMGMNFLNAASSPLTQNPANLSTQPQSLQDLDLSQVRQAGSSVSGRAVERAPNSESLASLQSQGKIAAEPAVNNAKFQDVVQEASQKYNVPVALINAVIKQESAFNPSAQSGAGAQGLMQLMPATAKAYGCSNSLDPQQNVMAGTRFLSDLLKSYKGDVELALAGYNAGPGNVAKYGNQVPPFRETQEYVVKVQGYYRENMVAMDKNSSRFA